jgi:hypothetical protein
MRSKSLGRGLILIRLNLIGERSGESFGGGDGFGRLR